MTNLLPPEKNWMANLKKREDEDDINDFFDKFKKTTGGKNFWPRRLWGRLCVNQFLGHVVLISSLLCRNRDCIIAFNVPAWSFAWIGISTTPQSMGGTFLQFLISSSFVNGSGSSCGGCRIGSSGSKTTWAAAETVNHLFQQLTAAQFCHFRLFGHLRCDLACCE
jgi:hypothetical protein